MSENIYTAVTVGDIATVATMLKTNPRSAGLRGGPYMWEPLLYATYSRLNSDAPGHSTLEVARLLLSHGAEPNAGYLWDGNYVFTALTGAFGEERVHQPEPALPQKFAIPPTAVGGYVQVQPSRNWPRPTLNTTNGSWWIVQVQPFADCVASLNEFCCEFCDERLGRSRGWT